MTPVTIYDIATRRIKRRLNVADAVADLQARSGEGAIIGVAADPSMYEINEKLELVLKVKVPPTIDELKSKAKASIAARRWEVETGGMTVGSSRVATDDRAKLLLGFAAQKAATDPAYTTRWKTRDGWITLDAAGLLTVYGAVFAHTAACFAAEEAAVIAIAAAPDEATVAAVEFLAP